MELRPYQQECVQAVCSARERGLQRVLYTAPTGTGKTQVFVGIHQQMGGRALVLAHREELLDQAANRFRSAGETWVDVEQGGRRAGHLSTVIAASVQTLARGERLSWFRPDLLVVDEAHHVCAWSYHAVLERFGCFKEGGPFLVGCTATPKRLDRLNLHAIFEEQVYAYSIRQAIQDGWLCDVRGFRVQTRIDLTKLRTTAGDFSQAELSKAVNVRARTEAAIRHWREVAADRPTIAFCVDRAHARAVAAAWRDEGAGAEHIDGSMGTEERRAILDRFRRGATRVLVNVELLTEGWDHPPTACAVMLRPTQSWALYTQMVGRTTRPFPGKRDSIILDVVDITRKHSLASVPAILDLPVGLDLQGRSLTEAADKLDELGARAAEIDAQGILTFAGLETLLHQVDLFADTGPAREAVEAGCGLSWLKLPGDRFQVSCGPTARPDDDDSDRRRPQREARLTSDQLGRWTLTLAEGRQIVARGTLPDGTDLTRALYLSEQAVLRRWPDSGCIAGQGARWRKGRPSERQVSALRRFGVAPEIIEQLDKGAASGMLTQLLARGKAA